MVDVTSRWLTLWEVLELTTTLLFPQQEEVILRLRAPIKVKIFEGCVFLVIRVFVKVEGFFGFGSQVENAVWTV